MTIQDTNEVYETIDTVRSVDNPTLKAYLYNEHIDFLLGRIAVLSDEICELKKGTE